MGVQELVKQLTYKPQYVWPEDLPEEWKEQKLYSAYESLHPTTIE